MCFFFFSYGLHILFSIPLCMTLLLPDSKQGGAWGVCVCVCVCVYVVRISFLGNGRLQNREACLLVGERHDQQPTEYLAKTNRTEPSPLTAAPAHTELPSTLASAFL